MKLTRRQEEFINNLLELNQEFDGPIHYSILAERLGVSPFTAYDMLCLLEDKGAVTSAYQIPTDKNGPGRAERVFFPTETVQARGQRLLEEASGLTLDGEELKLFILDKVRKGEIPDKELAEEILVRIPPDGQEQMRYCVEVMTIVALRLRQSSRRRILTEHFSEILPGNTPSCRSNLCLLGGFAFGILAQETSSDQEWVGKLFEQMQQYLDIILKMSPEDCHQLRDYLMAVFTPLTEGASNL